MHRTTAFGAVDLDTAAVDLARRLASLRRFLDAAHELLTISQYTFSQFKRHNRQIITLMEIARTTLTNAGIKLHLFTCCHSAMLPYKAVYYELLSILHHNRHNIDLNLRDRMSRLLFALSTRFVIVRKGDSSHLNWPADVDTWSRWRTKPSSDIRRRFRVSSSTRHEPERYASLMPPPDAFPPGRRELSIDLPLRGRSLRRDSQVSANATRVARTASPRRQSQLSFRADPAIENTPPSPSDLVGGVSRQRRSFGIFCTGKKSVMVRSAERKERAMSKR
ncbi:hypothetical protein PILCRDRAFT_812792 [Piloderma croceum F 1598]|uniref:Uncharacterized protein n=1 Tax=Piloderma croceum (strain F 1598) TaxID=765440 RepID=A0A0C3CJT4_PILCF|nr:hypothetical protein PILCRDRAFT_812792 [Piloderma croceum F 1598]